MHKIPKVHEYNDAHKNQSKKYLLTNTPPPPVYVRMPSLIYPIHPLPTGNAIHSPNCSLVGFVCAVVGKLGQRAKSTHTHTHTDCATCLGTFISDNTRGDSDTHADCTRCAQPNGLQFARQRFGSMAVRIRAHSSSAHCTTHRHTVEYVTRRTVSAHHI